MVALQLDVLDLYLDLMQEEVLLNQLNLNQVNQFLMRDLQGDQDQQIQDQILVVAEVVEQHRLEYQRVHPLLQWQMAEQEKMLHLSLICLQVYLIQVLDNQLQAEEEQQDQVVEEPADTLELLDQMQLLILVVAEVVEQVCQDQAEMEVPE